MCRQSRCPQAPGRQPTTLCLHLQVPVTGRDCRGAGVSCSLTVIPSLDTSLRKRFPVLCSAPPSLSPQSLSLLAQRAHWVGWQGHSLRDACTLLSECFPGKDVSSPGSPSPGTIFPVIVQRVIVCQVGLHYTLSEDSVPH